jgi:hypothetical protein
MGTAMEVEAGGDLNKAQTCLGLLNLQESTEPGKTPNHEAFVWKVLQDKGWPDLNKAFPLRFQNKALKNIRGHLFLFLLLARF